VVVVALLAIPAERASAGDARVAALQVAMTGEGLYPHPVDGVMGPWTQGAVRSFQASHGLTVDGVAGPQTRVALGKRGGPRLGSRPMREGQRGWDVAALQFLLHSRGFEPRGFDGGFGPNTADAVRRYQSAGHLDADGVAGPSTLNALRSSQVITATPSDPVRFLRPVPGEITDGFGWVGGRRHTGIDFPERMGTPIHAAGVGVVSFAGMNTGGYGNLVVITHRLGFETWYAHMSQVTASVGQAVQGGTTIGYVGSTGFSTGPHLHFEVRQYGTPIDPMPRLLGIVASARSRARSASRRGQCRPNADVRGGKNVQPGTARLDRCP
jgi:peptidoglycan hydrolase-like protein with peptidoglycan-binding domain